MNEELLNQILKEQRTTNFLLQTIISSQEQNVSIGISEFAKRANTEIIDRPQQLLNL